MTDYNPHRASTIGQRPIDRGLGQNSTTITQKIIQDVAEAADCPKDELPPLYEVIEPDALTNIFAPTYNGNERANGRVTFSYSGYKVTVENGNNIIVDPNEYTSQYNTEDNTN